LDLCLVALSLGIPLNRYDLSWLVNELSDHHWEEFPGEKVSDKAQKTLQDELDAMFSPSEAEAMGVTKVTVVEDVGSSSNVDGENANWVKDVFNDMNFSEGEVVFAEEKVQKTVEEHVQKSSVESSDLPSPSPNSSTRRVEGKSPGHESKPAVTPARELSGMLPTSLMNQKMLNILGGRQSLQGRAKQESVITLFGCVLLGIVIGVLLMFISSVF
jgi:hypothetical protein